MVADGKLNNLRTDEPEAGLAMNRNNREPA